MTPRRTIDLFAGPYRCIDCGLPKAHGDMRYVNRTSPTGQCHECRTAYRKRKYAEDPERAKAYAREWKERNRDRIPHYSRRYRHGIEPEDFTRLLEAQNGRCAICAVQTDDLRVDHCHSRKMIRGLLCDRCNRGIGFFDDDPDVLRVAAEYVEREGVMPHAPRSKSC